MNTLLKHKQDGYFSKYQFLFSLKYIIDKKIYINYSTFSSKIGYI